MLVPGCGSGHEVRAFAAAGHDVVAIDFSPAAIEAARRVLGELGRLLVQGDFFAHALGEFDLVYERAFLCALPARALAALGRAHRGGLAPGRAARGLLLLVGRRARPPFGLKPEELETAARDAAFDRIEDAAVADSIPVFAGRERWQVWRRR